MIILRNNPLLLLVVIFTIILVGCGGKTVQGATNLTDISDHWAYPYISELVNQGDISGYADGTFKPNQKISRAEFFTIINKAYNFGPETNISFIDVGPGDWYYHEIARAKAAGYVSGYPDGTIKPNNSISRQEAAVIITKALNMDTSRPGSLPFSDAASIPSWSRNYIAAMVQAGYMSGYPDGTFKPEVSLSRAEAAYIIVKGQATEVVPGTLNVKDFGAEGDGITDDTTAIQKVIDRADAKGGGTVFIPDGEYLIDAEVSINMRNNTNLMLADDAVLQAKPTSNGIYNVIKINAVSNVEISGGKIIGERNAHTGKQYAHGMGIGINGSNNLKIHDIYIADCWGDGIYVGAGAQNYCRDVVIERVTCYNNRRLGMAVISAQDLTIRDCTVSNNQGTAPGSGIDIEPNESSEFLQNILIENLKAADNAYYGVIVSFASYQAHKNPISITLKNIDYTGSYAAVQLYKINTADKPKIIISGVPTDSISIRDK